MAVQGAVARVYIFVTDMCDVVVVVSCLYVNMSKHCVRGLLQITSVEVSPNIKG